MFEKSTEMTEICSDTQTKRHQISPEACTSKYKKQRKKKKKNNNYNNKKDKW